MKDSKQWLTYLDNVMFHIENTHWQTYIFGFPRNIHQKEKGEEKEQVKLKQLQVDRINIVIIRR